MNQRELGPVRDQFVNPLENLVWGGSSMIGMQEMLMQTHGGKIRLLPAWPADWDVDFKLHAAHPTVAEGKVRGGKVIELNVTPESRRHDVIYPGHS